jgi:hypothetical protein
MSKTLLLALLVSLVLLQGCTCSRVLIGRSDAGSRRKGRNRLSTANFKVQGGAMLALGNITIKRLARRAQYRGHIEHLVAALDSDDDLVRDSRKLTECKHITTLVP